MRQGGRKAHVYAGLGLGLRLYDMIDTIRNGGYNDQEPYQPIFYFYRGIYIAGDDGHLGPSLLNF